MSTTLQSKPFEGCKSIQYFDLPELYYKPETFKLGSESTEYEIEPPVFEYMIYLFITNGEEQYGYYCGLTALNDIGGTTQVPALRQIRSNNIDKITEYTLSPAVRFKVYPSEVKITKENAIYLQILDTIEEKYDYFDDIYDFTEGKTSTQEENVIVPIKRAISVLNLSLDSFQQHLKRYSYKIKSIIFGAFISNYLEAHGKQLPLGYNPVSAITQEEVDRAVSSAVQNLNDRVKLDSLEEVIINCYWLDYQKGECDKLDPCEYCYFKEVLS